MRWMHAPLLRPFRRSQVLRVLWGTFRSVARRRGEGKEDQAERVIRATELNTLLCVYPWSINVVVYHDPSGRIHLGSSHVLHRHHGVLLSHKLSSLSGE
jgi:hypothetical protein